uniref:Major facilitator superfamily (MFS) profile domain-containing protein n=2 Tax=Sar TaxID=2698737 RepID=A0A7S2RUV3_9STRA|mmetsp:Transcript_45240/g.72575  ORF Transcript_45240/g.72575 Transcript_45240/m.72575 type:complete len:460 (+) Transcript_45240:284-1663(+)
MPQVVYPSTFEVEFGRSNAAVEGTVDFNDEKRRPSSWNLFLVRLYTFLLGVSMTIVFTTATSYTDFVGVQSAVFPGLMIGLVPLASGLSSVPWGWVMNRFGFKTAFIAALACGGLGSVLYALAGVAQSPSLMLVGRLLLGVAGPDNLYVEHHALTLGKQVKSVEMNTTWAVATLGFGFGPLLSAGISWMFGNLGTASATFNTMTIPGWTSAILYGIAVLMYIGTFTCPNLEVQKEFKLMSLRRAATSQPSISFWKDLTLLVVLFSAFAGGVGVSGLETRTALIAEAPISDVTAWAWNETYSGLYLSTFFSLIALGSWMGGHKLHEIQLSDRFIVLYSLIACTVSCIFLFDFGFKDKLTTIFLWSAGVGTLGLFVCIVRSYLVALGVKLCPTDQVSNYSSMLTLFSSFGRFAGPMAASYIGNGYLDQSAFSICLMSIFGVNLVLFATKYTKLHPALARGF